MIIGLKETADILGMGRQSLANHLKSGEIEIPFARFGRKYLFKKQDVLNYFERSFTTEDKYRPRPRKKKEKV